MNEKIELHCQQGGSDKVYIVELKQTTTGNYLVHCHYGRRGGTLNFADKTPSPVSYLSAKTIFDKVVKEKTSKGYQVVSHTRPTGSTPSAAPSNQAPGPKPVLPGVLMPQLLNHVCEGELESLLDSDEWWAQEKMDGERRPVSNDGNGKWSGWNKKGEMVDLPEIVVQELNKTPFRADTVLDGEIIGDVYFPFDALMVNGTNLRDVQLQDRARVLLDIQLSEHIRPVSYFKHTDDKRGLLAKVKGENGEGLVFKRRDSFYVPGRPNSGGDQLKHKFVESATLVVVGSNKDKRSVKIAGYDENLQPVNLGNVTIPANHEVPEKGAIVEVRYLYAYKGGSLYQPVYLGVRNDQTIDDCVISQLKYKRLRIETAPEMEDHRWAW